MNDKTDSKVTDLRNNEGEVDDAEAVAEALQAPPQAGQAEPATHWAIPIQTVQGIIKYLKRQPMDDVEQFVYDVQDQAVPLALKRDK